MEIAAHLIEFIIHVDLHLMELIQQYGTRTYIILFIIIFCETGLVIMPFLPGDSLLFAAGAIASKGALDVFMLFSILTLAAFLGDTVNYFIGRLLGPKVFRKENIFLLNKKHLEKAHRFYEKHGGKTIILARFIPIIRTFAPFVAGIGNMNYGKFLLYNITGGLLWVFVFLSAGFFFGNIPVVKNNFSIVILIIIGLSILPVVFEFLRQKVLKKSGN